MFSAAKSPKIEFFTEHEALLPFAPKPAHRFYPEWFKRMDSSHAIEPSRQFPFGIGKNMVLSNINSTIKRCPGVVSFLAEGYIVPLWSDIVVQVRANSIFAFASNQSVSASLHGRHIHFDQMPNREAYYHDALKFTNPWKIVTPKGWSVLVTAPYYHFEDRYEVVPGVIDSDSYHHMHVNTFFKRGEADHQLKMGSPFIQVIPFQRDALEAEVRVATEDDKKRLENLRFRSDKFFKKNQSIKDTGEE